MSSSSNPTRRTPRPTVVVDDKYMKEMDKKIKAMQTLAKEINAGKKYEQVVNEANALRSDIEKRKSEVTAAELEKRRIIEEAAKEAKSRINSSYVEVERLLSEAKEARNKIIRDAGSTLSKAQNTEKELQAALADVLAQKLAAETKASELKEMIARQNVQWGRIDDAKKIISERELEAEKKLEEAHYLEQKADEDWMSARLAIDGLKQREQEIAQREAIAEETLHKGKALVQQADHMFKDLTARKASVETKEVELRNMETRIEVGMREFSARENALNQKERDIEYRDKECQIREAQIAARARDLQLFRSGRPSAKS